MAKRLRLFDKQGNPVVFDISSASVTIDAEGKSLDVKLSELVAAIASAVKSVTFNGSTPAIDSNGNVNLGKQMNPDWNESNPNWPSFIANKPSVPSRTSQLQNDSGYITEEDLPEGVECDEQMSSMSVKPVQNKVIKAYVDNLIAGLIDGAPAALDTLKELATALGNNSDAIATIINTLSSKANAAEVYTKGQVDTMVGGKQDVLQFDNEPTENSVKMVNSGAVYEALMTLLGNITIDSNGNWKIGNISTNYSAKGMQGETVLVTGDPVTLVGMLVNDLFTPSAEKGTSAGVAVIIRNNVDILQAKVDALIDALAPLAFVGQGVAKAGLLDWSGNNVFFVTVGYDLKGVTASDNTDEDSHLVVGGNLQVTLAATQYYLLTGATIEVKDDKNNSVAYTLNGNTLTINNLTRSVTIKVVGVLSGAHLVIIPAVEHLTFKDENDNEVSGELIVPDGDPLELTLVPDELWGISAITVLSGGDDVTSQAFSERLKYVSGGNVYDTWEETSKNMQTVSWLWSRKIEIAAIDGDVEIAVEMEDWNIRYNNVSFQSSGRIKWNYYSSSADQMSPFVPRPLGKNYTASGCKLNGFTAKAFNALGGADYSNTSEWSSQTYFVATYTANSVSSAVVRDGSTEVWRGSADIPYKPQLYAIARLLPTAITGSGYRCTSVDTTESPTGLWPYCIKLWSGKINNVVVDTYTSACSFMFNLPGVASLKVCCGNGTGTLYCQGGSLTAYQVTQAGENTITGISTSHTKAFLKCDGGEEDLHNSYVKYGDKYIWWGKDVNVDPSDVWDGIGVTLPPLLVTDIWNTNNE